MMNHRTTHRVMDLAKLRDRLGYRDVVPAREASVAPAAGWSEHPPGRGGDEEAVLEDPFDYAAEDRLVAWWRTATADPPDLGYATPPGYGLAYGGPGATSVRSDDRI